MANNMQPGDMLTHLLIEETDTTALCNTTDGLMTMSSPAVTCPECIRLIEEWVRDFDSED